MQTKLPLFEDLPVFSSELRLSGKSVERVGALDVGEEVFLLVRAYVSGVNHATTDDGLIRKHALHGDEMVLILPKDGQRMLDEAKLLSDDRFGLQSIFDGSESLLASQPKVDPDTGEIGGEDE